MDGRTPSDAVASFLSGLREAIRCVAHAEVVGGGQAIGALSSVTIVARGNLPRNVVLLRLRTGRAELHLNVFVQYTVVHLPDMPGRNPYRVLESRYIYTVSDRLGPELFAYHWHPVGVSHIEHPHLHLSWLPPIILSTAPGRPSSLELPTGKAHFPTGRVSLQDVIRLLIEDLGVEPRNADWRRVLDTSQ